MRQLEDKERSMDVNELAKRNGPGEEGIWQGFLPRAAI
jgi:hypothetical protein